MGRTLDRRGRIGRNDLAYHQVIKEHLDGGQVLLDRLRRIGMFFDIGRYVHGSNQPNVVSVLFGQRQKLSTGPCVSFAGLLWDTAIEEPCFAVSLRFWHAWRESA
jgi:hypothetical protein